MPASLNVKARSGALWSILGKGSATLGNFLIGILLARLLSVEDFGIFMLSMSVVTTAAVVAQFGLPMAAVRLIPGYLSAGDVAGARRLGAGFWVLGSAAAFLVALLFICCIYRLVATSFSLPNLESLRWLMGFWIAMLALQAVAGETFRGMHLLGLSTAFGGVLFIAGFVPVLGALLWMGEEVSLEMAVALTVAILCASNLGSLIAARKVIHAKPALIGDELRKIAALSFSFSLTTTTIFAVSQADIWSLGYFYQGEDVGYYVAAVKLAGLVLLPLLVINTAVMHLVPQLYVKGSHHELSRLVRGGAGFAFLLATPVALTFVGYGDIAMGWVYGETFSVGAPILAILTLAHLVNVWTGPCALTLMMTGGQWKLVQITLLIGTLVFAGVFIVAPVGGPKGVALVVAGGLIVQNVLLLFSVRRRLGIWTLASFRDAVSFVIPNGYVR